MKLEVDYKENTGKMTNTCMLSNMLLNNEWVSQEIKEIKKYMETGENENTMVQNFLFCFCFCFCCSKSVLRGKS